jgi:hypothetical protein
MSFDEMSIAELEAYCDERRDLIVKAKAEAREAKAVLVRKLSAGDVAIMKARRDDLDAQIEAVEGSDG